MFNPMQREQLGVAVIGAGRIGAMRARLAAQHPAVNFIAVSDLKRDAAQALADKSIPHIYLPEVSVNMAFLGSSAPGDSVRLAR